MHHPRSRHGHKKSIKRDGLAERCVFQMFYPDVPSLRHIAGAEFSCLCLLTPWSNTSSMPKRESGLNRLCSS